MAMAAPAMPEVEAIWDGVTLGMLCEAGVCTPTLLASRVVAFTDGSWVRTTHDPDDPLSQFSEEGDDGAAELVGRFRSYVKVCPLVR